MNKYITLLSVGLTILILFFLLLENDESVGAPFDPTLKHQSVQKNNTDSPLISYQQNAVLPPKSDDNKSLSEKHIPKREKYVESKALSAHGVYEISLINTAQDLSKQYNKLVFLQGNIDGSTFLLKIPDYLLESDTDKIKLRIKKLSSGDEKFIPIPFLTQMANTSQQISLEINFDNPENYSYKEQPVIVPVPN